MTNDNTVERCERYARGWGWGGLHATNIFALRSTNPKGLYSFQGDPTGEGNDAAILGACRTCPIPLLGER